MQPRECPIHHVSLERVAATPISRCPNCHYMSHYLQFERCPACGRRLQIEEPEPVERCPRCQPAGRATVCI